MADSTITNLPVGSTTTGAELVPIVQNGATVRVSLDVLNGYTPPFPNASTTTQTAKNKQHICVKDFLCTDGQAVQGNNAHDDTTGIQRAIDYASSLGGGTVFLPTGIYVLTANLTLKSNVNIVGDGKFATTIRTQNYGAGASFNAGGTSSAILYGVDVDNILIENLTLKGVSIDGVASNGIRITRYNNDNIAHIIVRNVFVNDHAGTGISINCPILCTFQNVKVRYCVGSGISCYNGGTSCGFYECYVVTTTETGFEMNTMVYCTFVSCAAEVTGIGYNFTNCSAMALIGCGAESNIYRSATYPGISYKTNNSSVAAYSCYSTKSAVSETAYNAGGSYSSIEAGHFSGNFSLHNCRMMTWSGTSVVANRFVGLKVSNIPTTTTPPIGTGSITTGTVWSDGGVLKIV